MAASAKALGANSGTPSPPLVPDGVRNGEIRGLRNPMRVIQVAAKIYF